MNNNSENSDFTISLYLAFIHFFLDFLFISVLLTCVNEKESDLFGKFIIARFAFVYFS